MKTYGFRLFILLLLTFAGAATALAQTDTTAAPPQQQPEQPAGQPPTAPQQNAGGGEAASNESESDEPSDPLSGNDSLAFEHSRIERLEFGTKPMVMIPEPERAPEVQSLEYESPEIDFRPSLDPPEVIALQIERQEWPMLYNNYARLAIGSFLTPVAEVYLNSGRDKHYDWGAEFKHRSTAFGHAENAQFGDNRLRLKGKILNRYNEIYANAGFDNFKYFMYGVKQGDSIRLGEDEWRDQLRRNYSRFDAQIGLRSHYKKRETFYYDASTRLRRYWDETGRAETLFSLNPSGSIAIMDSTHLELNSEITVGSVALPAYAGGESDGRFFLDLTPQLYYKKSSVQLHAGIRANIYSDSAGARFNLYPAIRADFIALPPYVTIFAGVEGRTIFNRFYDLAARNPYMDRRAYLRESREKYIAYGGAKGSFEQLTWQIKAHMRAVSDAPAFFAPNESGEYFNEYVQQGRFLVMYEQSFREMGISIQANYDYDENVRAGAAFDYRGFTLENLEYNFHVPNAEFLLYGSYTWNKKLTARTEWRYIGARPLSLGPDGELEEAKGFMDVNVLADYQLSERFSIFGEINNLLSQRYYRWNDYRERPFDIRGGVTVSF